MPHPKKNVLTAFVLATLIGVCLHFVYALLPNVVTALFSPVNESIWEHLKLIYFPLLVSALLLTRRGEKGCRAAWMLSLLLVCAAMLFLGWLYHVPLRGESHLLDRVLYVLLMAAGFLLPSLLDRSAIRARSDALTLAVAVLGAAIILFTFLPPDHVLFSDLSRVNTWITLPC